MFSGTKLPTYTVEHSHALLLDLQGFCDRMVHAMIYAYFWFVFVVVDNDADVVALFLFVFRDRVFYVPLEPALALTL